jgi:hypothetical protein
VFPTFAIILSALSFINSRKSSKIQLQLNEMEKKLKKYELEDKEKELEEAKKSCVEARIIKVSDSKYRIKFWNSGKTTAFNVDYKLPEEFKGHIIREKVPYEYLESGKGFEEIFVVILDTPRKFIITTTWQDIEGKSCSKEQIVSI